MKIGFLFAGQGAQYVGMGKELSENFKVAKDIFEEGSEALDLNLSELCFNDSKGKLNITEFTQPAILTTSIAALKVLQSNNIECSAVAGLSLGEYSAHVCAETFDFATGVKLVKKRGELMQNAVPLGVGAMSAVLGLDEKEIGKVLEECKNFGVVEIANLNCPGQIVIGGEKSAVESATPKLLEAGAKRLIPLNVSGPFHTSLLRDASLKLAVALENVKVNSPKIPILTNVTGDYIQDVNEIKPLLIKQVMSSVRWQQTIENMINDGIDTFIEIGPGKALSGFVRKINKEVKALNVEDIKSLEKTLESLK